MAKPTPILEFRLRFPEGHPEAFGPGKADLLEGIRATGSIRAAAGRMEMSYNRAWTLVRAMNRLFLEPLVVYARGGEKGDGASLTPLGLIVLRRYRRMEQACGKACAKDWASLQALLR